jgi:hypothetical protein
MLINSGWRAPTAAIHRDVRRLYIVEARKNIATGSSEPNSTHTKRAPSSKSLVTKDSAAMRSG